MYHLATLGYSVEIPYLASLIVLANNSQLYSVTKQCGTSHLAIRTYRCYLTDPRQLHASNMAIGFALGKSICSDTNDS